MLRADIVLAVSGGPDSVAMATLFRILARRGGPRAAWAHLNHRLRGGDSDADERFVRGLARRWSVPLLVRRADVALFARREGRSIEEAGRILRYRFLEAVARRTGARLVATAHTADDQAATVLMRLERGAGARGLSAIPEIRPIREGSPIRLVRPLLSLRKRDLVAWLSVRGVPFRVDATNDDLLFRRNRVRRLVLAPWERRDPRIVERLCALAGTSRRLQGIARPTVDAAVSRIRPLRPASPGILTETFRALSGALGREVLRETLLRSGIGGITRLHLERLDRFLRGAGTGRSLSFPGGSWRTDQGLAAWVPAGVKAPAVPAPLVIRKPGSYRWGTWKVSVGSQGALLPVTIRARRAGDRIRLPGGTRKLSDLFIDAKIPRALRDRIPVLEAGGRILAAGPFSARPRPHGIQPGSGRRGPRRVERSSPPSRPKGAARPRRGA